MSKKNSNEISKRSKKEPLNSSLHKSIRPTLNMSNLYCENFGDISTISTAKHYRKEPNSRKSQDFRNTFLNSSLINSKNNPNDNSPVRSSPKEEQSAKIENISTAGDTLEKFNIVPKQFFENSNSILGKKFDFLNNLLFELENEELNFNPIQQELLKKVFEEFRVIGEILNECNSETLRRTSIYEQEVISLFDNFSL